MDNEEFDALITAINRDLEAMRQAAESAGQDNSAAIAAQEQERNQIIRDHNRGGDEPPGGALVGSRIKPMPPTRPGENAKLFPPENEGAEI